MELLNVFFFLTTVCVKLLGLYLPLYMFCCMRASISGLMSLLVLWFFPLNIFIQSGRLGQWRVSRRASDHKSRDDTVRMSPNFHVAPSRAAK